MLELVTSVNTKEGEKDFSFRLSVFFCIYIYTYIDIYRKSMSWGDTIRVD